MIFILISVFSFAKVIIFLIKTRGGLGRGGRRVGGARGVTGEDRLLLAGRQRLRLPSWRDARTIKDCLVGRGPRGAGRARARRLLLAPARLAGVGDRGKRRRDPGPRSLLSELRQRAGLRPSGLARRRRTPA